MGTYKDLNDYELMYLIEEENEDAKDTIFEKYRPIVKSIALKYQNLALQSGIDFEDLMQEGYLGLYNAIKNYSSDRNALFYTFATISIRSRILNFIRTNTTKKTCIINNSISLYESFSVRSEITLMDVLEDKNALLPHLMIEENEIHNIIREFLLSLSFPNSLIFELKLNGFGNKDIGILLDMPIKTVTNSLTRIRKQCKSYLLNH